MSTFRVAQAGDKGSARDDRTTQQFEKDFNLTDLSFNDNRPNELYAVVGEITEVLGGTEAPRYKWKIDYVVNNTQNGSITYKDSLKSSILNGTAKGTLPHLIELNRNLSTDAATYEVGDKVIAHRVTDQNGIDQYVCLPKVVTEIDVEEIVENFITVEGDDIWTEESTGSPDFQVDHIGPDLTGTTYTIAHSECCIATVYYDTKGHCVGWTYLSEGSPVWVSPWGKLSPL
jgi:hypothetical protein